MFTFSECLIRKQRIVQTPEEEVRQRLIKHMLSEWGYPKGLLSVEKRVGSRRYDLVCYTPEMNPLLLVECKAREIDQRAIQQVIGYNDLLNAPFLCLVSAAETRTLWFEGEKLHSISFLPLYSELYALSRRL